MVSAAVAPPRECPNIPTFEMSIALAVRILLATDSLSSWSRTKDTSLRRTPTAKVIWASVSMSMA